MRVIGVCCYRNEADVIEAFVRHTAPYCDALILLDHGSTDASPAIVRQLQAEGLPLHLLSDATLGNVEVEHANRLLALAVNEFDADWVLSLDADEFVVGAPDNSFLGALPPSSCMKVRTVTYYPQPSDRSDFLNPVERITHRVAGEDAGTVKVFVPAALARIQGSFLSQGKHEFFTGPKEAPALFLPDVALAHFSLRSPAQYAMKLVAKQLQKLRRIGARGDELAYYNKPYVRLKESYSSFTQDFYHQRLAYRPAAAAQELVHDPIAYRGGALRYTERIIEQDNFICELLDLSEELARSASQESEPTLTKGDGRRLALELTAYPTPGHTEVRNMVADATRFRTVTLTVDCPPDATELQIKLICEPALIEISELVVNDERRGEDKVYRAEDLEKMLRALSGGAIIAGTDVFRLLVSKDPVVLLFRGWRASEISSPGALEVRLRLRVEHRLLSAVLLSPSVLNRMAVERRELEQVSARLQATLAELALAEKHVARITYEVGSNVRFGEAESSDAFLGSGWSLPEPGGIWSDGERAVVRLRLREAPSRTIHLRVRLVAFVRPNHPCVSVRLRAGDAEIAAWTIDSAEPIEHETVISPVHLAEADCELTFEIANPVSPAELGLSNDLRRLGIFLQSLQLQWEGEADSATAQVFAAGPNGNVS